MLYSSDEGGGPRNSEHIRAPGSVVSADTTGTTAHELSPK